MASLWPLKLCISSGSRILFCNKKKSSIFCRQMFVAIFSNQADKCSCENFRKMELLSGEDAASTYGLDLLLGDAGEEPGLHDHGLLGKNSLAQNLR